MPRIGDATEVYRQVNPREEEEVAQRRRRGLVDLVENQKISLRPGREFDSMAELRAAHMRSASRGLDQELARAALQQQAEEA